MHTIFDEEDSVGRCAEIHSSVAFFFSLLLFIICERGAGRRDGKLIDLCWPGNIIRMS